MGLQRNQGQGPVGWGSKGYGAGMPGNKLGGWGSQDYSRALQNGGSGATPGGYGSSSSSMLAPSGGALANPGPGSNPGGLGYDANPGPGPGPGDAGPAPPNPNLPPPMDWRTAWRSARAAYDADPMNRQKQNAYFQAQQQAAKNNFGYGANSGLGGHALNMMFQNGATPQQVQQVGSQWSGQYGGGKTGRYYGQMHDADTEAAMQFAHGLPIQRMDQPGAPKGSSLYRRPGMNPYGGG
jgi:hypothetical protein